LLYLYVAASVERILAIAIGSKVFSVFLIYDAEKVG
jgi:hypothetical protein